MESHHNPLETLLCKPLALTHHSYSVYYFHFTYATIAQDEQLYGLTHAIWSGWSETRKQFCRFVTKHCNKITEASGNFLKGEKIITPHKLRKDMLHCIHAGHFGTEKNKHQTRAIIFWHGLSRQIAETIMKCDICQTHHNSNQKEPLLLQAVPENQWQTVATDLFHWKSENYIVICDYLTRYF